MVDVYGTSELTIVVAYDHLCPPEEWLDFLSDTLNADVSMQCEITIEEYSHLLAGGYKLELLNRSAESVLRSLRLLVKPKAYTYDLPSFELNERICIAAGSKKETLHKLSDILAADSFYEEVGRVYSKANARSFRGHPVHYYISSSAKAAAADMVDVLVSALLRVNRLLSGRILDISKMTSAFHNADQFDDLFYSAQGATVVLNLAVEEDKGVYATGMHVFAEKLGEQIQKYGNSTLFVLVDISGNQSLSNDIIATLLAKADMIRICEGQGDLRRATEYLKRLAAKTEYKNYNIHDLVKCLPHDKELFSVSDIFNAYNRWYGRGLKTHIYKAYKENDIVRIECKKRLDKPYEQLHKMVGLADVKKVTDEILAVAKMQKIRKQMDLPVTNSCMHLLFSGNPGTAKTTVARLLAQILKDQEVLTNGHIVECGRQDLVGKYVGWTAKIVEEKFKAARGGILFIDEAYSLVEDGRTYGAEAINTIVQQMENYREDTIVIFAGYPDKMRDFLAQNEGLASRIAFHLNFPDYTPDELIGILQLMLEKQQYCIDENTLEKCRSIFSEVCKSMNYGNGRFVRNLLEHAIMRQADRLLGGNETKEVTKEEASLLIADDFELIEQLKEEKTKTIGFVV